MSVELRFKHPPVRGVTLTVDLDALPTMQVSHLATLLSEWRSVYPKSVERPPSAPWNEDGATTVGVFDSDDTWPFPSLWLSTGDSSRVLTLEQDRFSLRWAFADDDERPYPGYLVLKRELKTRFTQFSEMIRGELGLEISPKRVSARYNNQVASELLPELLESLLGLPSGRGRVSELDYLGFRLHNCASDENRNCSVLVGLDDDREDDSPADFFVATQRVLNSEADIWDDLDCAHDVLIERFLGMLTPTLRESWGAHDNSD